MSVVSPPLLTLLCTHHESCQNCELSVQSIRLLSTMEHNKHTQYSICNTFPLGGMCLELSIFLAPKLSPGVSFITLTRISFITYYVESPIHLFLLRLFSLLGRPPVASWERVHGRWLFFLILCISENILIPTLNIIHQGLSWKLIFLKILMALFIIF